MLILKKEEILQFKLKTEQEIEKVSQILNEKHLELLELMFPGWFKKFENVKSKIFKNNVTRVQITFKWEAARRKFSYFEINFKISKSYLIFSLKTTKMLDMIFEDDFDSMKLATYLDILEIHAKVVPISKSGHSKNGTCGKKHSTSKHESNGFGKLPKSLKGKNKPFTRKQKKKLKEK